ncbi:efflux RND transporter periplasmic adaptor subunit [Acanthopleuribacter pedis]|uniref:Efflux RND transporter periplasmic adaptor subunit n=1 Tax=Acanthopleuribacter pedis TaxID=442870 RepID=A0A8J7Q896_9BACT|nr:efflux RND transporter periplasmic adaptor subunit [Acanthopleuribacter pedis]
MRLLTFLASLCLTTLVLFVLWWKQPAFAEPQPAQQPLVVATAPVTLAQQQSFRLYGVTRARDTANLSFTVGGRLETRPFEVGQQVAKDQVLAQLDADPFRHQLAGLQGNLTELNTLIAQAERDQNRSSDLFQRGAATKEEVEKVGAGLTAQRAKRDALQAQIKEIRRLIDETTLRAPVAGVVTQTFIEAGEYARPGAPIYALSGAGAVEVAVEVPESLLPHIRLGMSVSVDFPLLGRRAEAGTVRHLGSSSLGPGHLFPVHVAITPFDGLISGLTAEVAIAQEDEPQISIPVEAVLSPSGERAWTFVLVDGRAKRVPLQLLQLQEQGVIVRGALKHHDRVVIGAPALLHDGDPVIVGQAVTP